MANLSPEQFPVRFHSISKSTGDVPHAREGATLTYVSGHLFLFGGYGADDGFTHWQKTSGFVLLFAAGSPSRGKIVVVGGCDSRRTVQRCYNDIWRLDARTYTWTLLAASDPKLAPRERHGAVILKDVVSFKVAPCGGGSVCSGRGSCAGASCACYPGWTSPDCGEVLDCPGNCNFSGICLSGSCTCFFGYRGNSCYQVLCPGSGLNGMCNGQGECLPSGACSCNMELVKLLIGAMTGVSCEFDIWGSEERARRAKGAKRLSREHEAPNLSALMDFDLRAHMEAIWRDIVRDAGGVCQAHTQTSLGFSQWLCIHQDLPPLGQVGEIRGSATTDEHAGGRLSWSLHWPEAKLPSSEEVKEALHTLTEVLSDQLPSISTTVRVAMAPVSLGVALATLYGMYRVNRSRV
ncbi:hypothetical protein Efla_003991 [Eimeria flavescens]